MAYCPKCGVEVENTVRSCPLCEFPIPDIREGSDVEVSSGSKYPEAQNIYEAYTTGIKNQVFFITIVLFASALVVLTTASFLYPLRSDLVRYLIVIILSLFLYTFFGFGYLRWSFNISGMFLTTLFLTYFIALISGGVWFMSYALPLSVWLYLNVIAFHYIYRHSKKKERLGYLPTFGLLISSSICLGFDGIITYNLYNQIAFTWSIIVTVTSILVGYILHVIINHIPAHTKENIRRRFHI